jgi:hypothetical protein
MRPNPSTQRMRRKLSDQRVHRGLSGQRMRARAQRGAAQPQQAAGCSAASAGSGVQRGLSRQRGAARPQQAARCKAAAGATGSRVQAGSRGSAASADSVRGAGSAGSACGTAAAQTTEALDHLIRTERQEQPAHHTQPHRTVGTENPHEPAHDHERRPPAATVVIVIGARLAERIPADGLTSGITQPDPAELPLTSRLDSGIEHRPEPVEFGLGEHTLQWPWRRLEDNQNRAPHSRRTPPDPRSHGPLPRRPGPRRYRTTPSCRVPLPQLR